MGNIFFSLIICGYISIRRNKMSDKVKGSLKIDRKMFVALLATVLFVGIYMSILSPNAQMVPDHVVISEVQVSGDTSNDEFIELYNPTDHPISLEGWYLTKKTAGGTETNLLAGFPNKDIPSHGFFLITPQSGYTGSVAADATYTQTSNFIAPDNTIILYSDNKVTVVDKVGFGDATDNETLSFPYNPPSSQTIQRKNFSTPYSPYFPYSPIWYAPVQDTDDNSEDFYIGTPTPMNSSSPAMDTAPGPAILYDENGVYQGEYDSIQDAIDNAGDGYIIKVYPGTYDPIVINKEIKLVGDPTIDGHGGVGISIEANNTLVENFTILNSSAGIYIHNNSFTVQNATIDNCTIYN